MLNPLILVTNDDGISSKGLWTMVDALVPLGEVLVVAPDRQWSGGGRSMPPAVTGRLTPHNRTINGEEVTAYAVDASPALTIVHGVTELAPRPPALVVSGINFGSNLGTEVTISGTVGAALEGGAFGIPSLAISLEMDPAYHMVGDETADYSAAQSFTQQFAWYLLNFSYTLPPDIDALSINVPADASSSTPWRFTRLSRRRYYLPVPPNRAKGEGRPSYERAASFELIERDSDVWALKVDRVVSITPLSLDLTSRIDFNSLAPRLRFQMAAGPDSGIYEPATARTMPYGWISADSPA